MSAGVSAHESAIYGICLLVGGGVANLGARSRARCPSYPSYMRVDRCGGAVGHRRRDAPYRTVPSRAASSADTGMAVEGGKGCRKRALPRLQPPLPLFSDVEAPQVRVPRYCSGSYYCLPVLVAQTHRTPFYFPFPPCRQLQMLPRGGRGGGDRKERR